MDKQALGQNWVKFNIILDEDIVDMVSTLLADVIPSGLIEERLFEDLFPHEIIRAKVPVSLSAYFLENDELHKIKAGITTVLQDLASDFPIPKPTFSPLLNQDWTTAWQKDYKPIPLGKKLVVVPSWLENPHPDRLEIKMDPGLAFGSGTHPTTQLCLLLLERYLSENPVQTMIDIGCGSGILAIAAAKQGVSNILGVDIDRDTLQVARANAILNQINTSIDFLEGSVNEILKDEFVISSAPLVTANIIAPILMQLFGAGLDQVVDSGGSILLSGILGEQLPDLLNLLMDNDLTVVEQIREGEWFALQVNKP
jgi:ribosomal protein L11 methyltransferase